MVVALAFVALPARSAAARMSADAEATGRSRREARPQQNAEAARDEPREDRLVPLSVDVDDHAISGREEDQQHALHAGGKHQQAWPGRTGTAAHGCQGPGPDDRRAARQSGGPGRSDARTGELPGHRNQHRLHTRKWSNEGFELRISVSDTSVYANIQDNATPTVGNMPVFRSFQSTNTLVLRDGQRREFTAATDRVSGEVIRIGVTLRVVK